MVADAEKFAESDKLLKEKIDAKHQLDNYIYQMRNTIEDKEKLADKLSEEENSAIADALTETQDWLNSIEAADKDHLEEQLKDLQRVCDPIIAKVYQQQGGQGQDFDDEEFEDL